MKGEGTCGGSRRESIGRACREPTTLRVEARMKGRTVLARQRAASEMRAQKRSRDGAGAVVAARAGVLAVDKLGGDVDDGLGGRDGGGDGEERVHVG